jgi:hypothetical protein
VVKESGRFIVVEGRQAFPVDMLRYDSCLPAREVDSYEIARRVESGGNIRARRVVILRALSSRTSAERWESFGYHVLLQTHSLREAEALDIYA